jgi:hypothetical protein
MQNSIAAEFKKNWSKYRPAETGKSMVNRYVYDSKQAILWS